MKAEANLIQKIQSDEESDKMHNTFYMMAHDIKSPIHQVEGLIGLAKQARGKEDMNDILEMALKANKQLMSNVEQILSMAVQKEEPKQKIDFSTMLNSICESLHGLEGYENTKFIINIHDNLNYYENPLKLRSVFQNLIENALKYRRLDSDKNIIVVSISSAEKCVLVKISDNGQGIKKSLIPNIFDKAYRINDNIKGHGLGLHLVKTSLNELGAQIEVESTEGEGTTFTIKLPLTLSIVDCD